MSVQPSLWHNLFPGFRPIWCVLRGRWVSGTPPLGGGGGSLDLFFRIVGRMVCTGESTPKPFQKAKSMPPTPVCFFPLRTHVRRNFCFFVLPRPLPPCARLSNPFLRAASAVKRRLRSSAAPLPCHCLPTPSQSPTPARALLAPAARAAKQPGGAGGGGDELGGG